MLCDRYDAEDIALCGSGTGALQLAFGALASRVGHRPRFALPAFACFDVVTAVVGSGAALEFYDVDPGTLGPDPDSLVGVLARGVDAVVLVHLYGVPLDWTRLQEAAAQHGAILIEDAAQGQGGALHGRALGTLGALAVLSFGRGKGWTGVRGGALLLRTGRAVSEAASAGPARELGVLIGAAAQWALARPGLYAVPASLPVLGLGATRYREPHATEGMTRTAAALLLASDAAARRESAHRRRVGGWYHERLRGAPGIEVVSPPADGEPGYVRFPVLLQGRARAAALEPKARKLGIAPSYPRALPDLPAARRLAASGGDAFPGAARLVRGLFTLPTHSRLRDAERAAVLRLITG